jgi:hypothetical protein
MEVIEDNKITYIEYYLSLLQELGVDRTVVTNIDGHSHTYKISNKIAELLKLSKKSKLRAWLSNFCFDITFTDNEENSNINSDHRKIVVNRARILRIASRMWLISGSISAFNDLEDLLPHFRDFEEKRIKGVEISFTTVERLKHLQNLISKIEGLLLIYHNQDNEIKQEDLDLILYRIRGGLTELGNMYVFLGLKPKIEAITKLYEEVQKFYKSEEITKLIAKSIELLSIYSEAYQIKLSKLKSSPTQPSEITPQPSR